MSVRKGVPQKNINLLCIGGLGVGKHAFAKCYKDIKDSETALNRDKTQLSKSISSVKSEKRENTGAVPLLGLTADALLLPWDKMMKKNVSSVDLRDTPSQEIEFHYHTITFRCEGLEEQLQQIDGILFMFSMGDVDSFSAMMSTIKLCYKLRRGTTKESPFVQVLLGTKCDQPVSTVSLKEIKELAMEVNLPYFITSSITKYGIQDTVDYIEYQMNCMESVSATLSAIISRDKLLNAVAAGNMTKIVESMESGKSPSQALSCGWAPIHIACWVGQVLTVAAMIQFEPNSVNAVSNLGWTPLHCASRSGHLKIVEMLLHRGANTFLVDNRNLKALMTSYVEIKETIQDHITSRNKHSGGSSSRRRKTVNARFDFSRKEKIVNLSFADCLKFPELKKFKNLMELSLMANNITEIPEEISVLEKLEVLLLFENKIEFIPESMSSLSKLRVLDVRCNQLTSINSSIGKMISLKELLLGYNKLAYLPTQLAELENTLEKLDIFGNPLTTLPLSIVPKLGQLLSQNNTQLFTYLSNLSKMGEEEYNHVKIMFVGEGNVGKTSLINSFIGFTNETTKFSLKKKDKEFVDTIATDGIDIHSINLPLTESKSMTWDCWDYAGQDIYYSTHQFFLSPRSVYLICWNLLDLNFAKIDYWLNSIHTRARGSPIFLIGTHFDDDAVTPEYVEEVVQKLFSDVKPERFKSLLGVQSVRGVYTVGSRKKIGIKELIDGIKQEVQKCKYVGQLYPTSWIKLNNTLSVLRQQKTKPLVSFDELERIAIGCGIEKSSVKDVARFLHQSGVICYFDQGSQKLQQHVILDPQFLTRVMSSIVTIRHRYGQDKASPGFLSRNDLPHVFSKFPADIHDSLMTLLEEFEIAFMIPKIDSYIIPSLLPENQPDIKENWRVYVNKPSKGRVLGRTYKFEFLPLGFFSRLFIRNYHLPKFSVTAKWRNGQILKYKNVSALFRYNPSTFVLRLEVHNSKAKDRPREYQKLIKVFRLLLENIDTTIEGWYETNITVTVPCSHCLVEGGYTNWDFSMKECMKNISEGKGYVLCRNVRKIRLDFLAPDLSFADLQNKIIPSEKLEIGAVIGVGAFGTVMKGMLGDHPVAIKQLTLTQSDDISDSLEGIQDADDDMGDKYAEFQREVWIMSCLNHKCVCGLIGLTMSPMAIVMDYLPNGDLYHFFDKFEKHTKEIQELLESFSYKILLAYDIARGVEHLHGYDPPIIHRDLRSPNIFVAKVSSDADCRAKVGDFGLSRVVAPTLAGGEFNANWLAPEVMRGNQYNGKMDVYSFGIIMWEIITLQKPFEEYDHKFSGKPKNMFKKAVMEGLRPTIPEHFDTEYVELMKQCWDDNPEIRPDFSQIVERLEVIMANRAVTFTSSSDADNSSLEVSKGSNDILSSGSVQIEEVVEFYKRLEPKHPHTVLAMSETHHQNGDFVISATSSGQLFVWDSKTFKNIKQISTSKKRIYAIYGTEDVLWAGCDDGSIIGYSTKDFKKCCEVKDSAIPVKAIVQYAVITLTKLRGKKKPRQFLCTGDADGNLYSWKVSKYKLELKAKNKVAEHIGTMILFNNYLCIGTEQDVLLVDKQNLCVVKKWSGHTQVVNSLVKYGKEIWSASSDATIRVWSEESDECLHSLTGHSAKVLSLTRTSRFIWSGSFDKTILLWDPKTKFVVQELNTEHSDAIRSLHSQNDYVWSGSGELDAHICVWRPIK